MNTNMFHEHRLVHYAPEEITPKNKWNKLSKKDQEAYEADTEAILATQYDTIVQEKLAREILEMDKIIKKGDNNLYAYTQRGKYNLELGNVEDSLDDLRMALNIAEGKNILQEKITSTTFTNPQSKALLSQIGECLRLMEDLTSARQCHEACFNIQVKEPKEPDDPEYYYRRGMAFKTKDPKKAESDFDKMLTLQNGSPKVYLAGKYFPDPRPHQELAILAKNNNATLKANAYERIAAISANKAHKQKAEIMRTQK